MSSLVERRFAALQWAAGLRGVSDPGEALDWMMQRGYAERDWEGDSAVILTEQGRERADEVLASLENIAESKRRRTNLIALGLAGTLLLWRWRR